MRQHCLVTLRISIKNNSSKKCEFVSKKSMKTFLEGKDKEDRHEYLSGFINIGVPMKTKYQIGLLVAYDCLLYLSNASVLKP